MADYHFPMIDFPCTPHGFFSPREKWKKKLSQQLLLHFPFVHHAKYQGLSGFPWLPCFLDIFESSLSKNTYIINYLYQFDLI